MKNGIRKIIKLFIVVGIIIVFLCLFNNYKFKDKYTKQIIPDKAITLCNNTFIQEFICDVNRSDEIWIKFGTYGRINKGNLEVNLYEDKKIFRVGKWRWIHWKIINKSFN